MIRIWSHFVAFLLVCLPGISEEVTVRSAEGEYYSLEVDASQPFHDVAEQIGQTFSSDGYIFDCSTHTCGPNNRRDYWHAVTSEEKNNIRYILRSMASLSWYELLDKKSSLEAAGDKIDHIHPLRFLATVFTDEELKGCVHAIRDRSLVWSRFFDPMKDTMTYESSQNNMKPEFVKDFAKKIKLKPDPFIAYVKAKNWDELMDSLLKQLPRQGNPERYDQ